MSLMATGTPCNGPIAWPLRRRSSSAARLRKRLARIEVDEGMHLVVERGDAVEAGARVVLSRYIAVGDPLGGLDGGE